MLQGGQRGYVPPFISHRYPKMEKVCMSIHLGNLQKWKVIANLICVKYTYTVLLYVIRRIQTSRGVELTRLSQVSNFRVIFNANISCFKVVHTQILDKYRKVETTILAVWRLKAPAVNWGCEKDQDLEFGISIFHHFLCHIAA